MKRARKDLEKLLKSVLRGESVDAARFMDAWKELGEEGDRLVASIWSRAGSQDAFVVWASGVPGMRAFLESLSRAEGLSARALERLAEAGVEKPGQDAPSSRVLWVCEVADVSDSDGDWVRARGMMLASRHIFEGAISLMELSPSQTYAEFLASLLGDPLSEEQDHRARKALYRMKQQGFSPDQHRGKAIQETEWYVFGENRLPLWQLALCFRLHSAFSGTGDLYILRILEGREFAQPEQKADLHITRSEFMTLANRYAEQVQRETGVPMKFHEVSTGHARYLLRESMNLLADRPGVDALDRFLRFLGAGEGTEPFAGEAPEAEGSDATLLKEEYFRDWMLDPGEFQGLFEELERMEKGPIVLVGSSQVEQKRAAAMDALQKHFDLHRRRLWSLAFRKAALFLGRNQAGRQALRISQRFADTTTPVESLDVAQILFDRTMEYIQRVEKERAREQKQTSLILTPDEFARARRSRNE